jgi:glycosyltransferase involved in cell wall biosynthesis
MPHFADDGNGVVYVATDLAYAQSEGGLSVACIGGRAGAQIELLRSRGVEVHSLTNFGSNPYFSPRGLSRLWGLLRTLDPQIVHAHTIPSALAAKFFQMHLGFDLVTSVHNGPRLKNLLLGVGDRIICVSAAVEHSMRRFPISARKLKTVRNGPLGSPRRPRVRSARSETSRQSPLIVTLAGLHTYKGIEDLIEAFAIARRSIPDISMCILGEGPERANLQKKVDLLGCGDRIHFLGFVNDPRIYLAKAAIFVLPSHREAFGLALAEAREAGCAVVATNVGGIPEVLEQGRRGILLPAKNPIELGRVVVELLSNPAMLRIWQERAASNLAWLGIDRACRETIDVYSELINRSSLALGTRDKMDLAGKLLSTPRGGRMILGHKFASPLRPSDAWLRTRPKPGFLLTWAGRFRNSLSSSPKSSKLPSNLVP